MRRIGWLCCVCVLLPSVCFAGKPVLLITPKGVWRSEVAAGVPGPWVPVDIDVIVQGFGDTPGDPNPPGPPATDQTVIKVAAVSKTTLANKDEGTAAAAVVAALAQQGLTGEKFREALELAAPIVDTSMAMQGRFTSWTKQVQLITTDPAKIRAGVISAWGLATSQLAAIQTSVDDKTQPLEAEAINFSVIIQIIQMILELLRNLGVI